MQGPQTHYQVGVLSPKPGGVLSVVSGQCWDPELEEGEGERRQRGWAWLSVYYSFLFCLDFPSHGLEWFLFEK